MTLNVNNTTINGISDFTAREEINLNSSFEANYGSEMHVYTSETFPNCYDYINFVPERATNILDIIDTSDNFLIKKIELQFAKKHIIEIDAIIIPNPNNGLFTIQLNQIRDDCPIQLKIKNLLGACLKEINTFGNNIIIDCSDFSKGIYFLDINTKTKIITKKFIIN
jgi:hypothetical protein